MIVVELIFIVFCCSMIVLGIFLIIYDKREEIKYPRYEAGAGICLGIIIIVIFGIALFILLQIEFNFLKIINDFLGQEI